MDKFNGKWESQPELTENLDCFTTAMEMSENDKEMFKKMVMICSISRDGDTIKTIIEYKGDSSKEELILTLGEPKEHSDSSGFKTTTTTNFVDDKFAEDHVSEKDGKRNSYKVERTIEDGAMVVKTMTGDAWMKSTFKKIAD